MTSSKRQTSKYTATVGGVSGAGVGATLGGIVGVLGGPVGVVAGATIGGVIGSVGGIITGNIISKKSTKNHVPLQNSTVPCQQQDHSILDGPLESKNFDEQNVPNNLIEQRLETLNKQELEHVNYKRVKQPKKKKPKRHHVKIPSNEGEL